MHSSSTASSSCFGNLSSAKGRQAAALPPISPTIPRGALQRRAAKESASADTDIKVERHRYAKFVLQEAHRYEQMASVEMFVESMLRGLLAQDNTMPQTRAAAASWAMKLLCQGPTQRMMEALVAALFPAIYCNYDERQLDYAPAAVQTLLNDRNLVCDNPSLSHVMYMQELPAGHAKIETLTERLQLTLNTNAVWRRFATRLVSHAQWVSKRCAFAAWRQYVRARRVNALLRRSVVRRHERMLCVSRLRAAFFQWKALVEVSRTEYLTERLHQAAFQLEGAKEQFELQCLHVDKLQAVHEQTVAELCAVSEERDALRLRVEELRETVVLRDREHAERLGARVRESYALLQQQRQTIEMAVATRFDAAALTMPWLDGAFDERDDDDDEGAAAAAAAAAPGAALATGPTGLIGSAARPSEPPGHALLLRWCDNVLGVVKGKRRLTVANFASDFANGQVYNLLLCHVFPDVKLRPLATAPASDIDVRNRLIRLCAAVRDETPLSIVLEPDDFIFRREDKIVVSVAELFIYHSNEKAAEHARTALSLAGPSIVNYSNENNNNSNGNNNGNPDHCRDSEAGGDNVATFPVNGGTNECSTPNDSSGHQGIVSDVPNEADLRQCILAWGAELRSWDAALRSCVARDDALQRCRVAIAQEAAHLFRRRASGKPVYLVTQAASKRYIAVSTSLMEDLRTRFPKTDTPALRGMLREGLRALLWRYAPVLARIFHTYAGADACVMSEVQFWRFVEECHVLVEPLSALVVAQIFDVVVSPHLVALMRSSVRDERARLRLAEVAQDEVEVRCLRTVQFIEIIVRMAAARYSGSLLTATERFLAALRLPDEMPFYLKIFYEPEAQDVIAYFQQDLSHIFFFYMRMQINASVSGRSRQFDGCGRYMARMARATYLRIFVDCEFLLRSGAGTQTGGFQRRTRFIAEDELLVVFDEAQQRIPAIPPGEICFSLFLETLSMLCAYWCPDPAVHFSRKLAAFIACLIEKLSVFHAQSTLVLSRPPCVSLEGDKVVDLRKASKEE